MNANKMLRAGTIGIGRAAITALRYAVFIPLYALRGIVRLLLTLTGAACYLAVAVSLVYAQRAGIVASMAVAGTVAFTLAWGYDAMLLRLSPRPLILVQ